MGDVILVPVIHKDVTRYPDGTGSWDATLALETAQNANVLAEKMGTLTWAGQLAERVAYVMDTKDPKLLRSALRNALFLIEDWIEDLEARGA